MSNQTPNSMPPWTPPHCPNPECPAHQPNPVAWHCRRRGSFRRAHPPYRVQRFECLLCHRLFSQQSFASTYWLKRPDLLPRIAELSVGGMANRQIARALRCAPATVDLQLSRLGRHCLLFQRQFALPPSTCRDIVVDGLVTFEYSQFHPFEILAAVDNATSFILHFTDAPLRRSGRMTAAQKLKRAKLEAEQGRPDARAVLGGMQEVLQEAVKGADKAIIRSDEHRAYPRALQGLPCPRTHRQISSKVRRDRRNELFEINALDMFIRHCSANHRRETIAFAKRRQGAAERLAVFVVWKNWVKRRWEKRCRQTPAMLLGLAKEVMQFEEILARRLFPTHHPLPPRWQEYYWRRVETTALEVNRKHALKFAI
jgi:transposase-like protein